MMTYLQASLIAALVLASQALLVSSIFVINANALPANIACSVRILDAGTNSQGVEIGMQIDDGTQAERLIQLTCTTYSVQGSSQGSSQGSFQGTPKGILHYYLRRRPSIVPSDGDIFSTFNARTGKYWSDSSTVTDWTLEPFIAWLLPLGLESQSQLGVQGYQQPPGLVLLRGGLLNGTLPVNATHMASIESQKLLSADVPAERNHRVSVYQMRSHLDRWKQLLGREGQTGRKSEHLHQLIQTELLSARMKKHKSKLIRVPRQLSAYDFDSQGRPKKWTRKPAADRIPYTNVTVKFNLETKYLTRKGPYLIRVHLHLDLEVKGNMKGNKEEMIKKAKDVVNFANSLLRPFNTYILVSSLHLPLSEQYGQLLNFKGNPIQFSREKYYQIETSLNYEVVDCVYIFMGKVYANDTVSDSEAEMCKNINREQLMRQGCVGYVVFDTNRPDHIKISGFALAHEVAQSLHCGHDVDSDAKEKCQCIFPKCVMETHAEPMPDSLPIGWSSCSIKRLVNGLDNSGRDQNGMKCLRPKSTGNEAFITQYSPEWGATCGNGVVEPGEDCDCGSARACKANRCCKQCRLASGAKCAVGTCCDLKTCAPSAKDQVCRGAWDPRCDIPEVCDGTSTVCPSDVMVSSAWACKSVDAVSSKAAHVCKNGICELKKSADKYSGHKCPADNVPLTNGKCWPKPVFKTEDVQGVMWPVKGRSSGGSNGNEDNENVNNRRGGAADDDREDDGARLIGACGALVTGLQSIVLYLLHKGMELML